ncbi:hypothetical protein GCM10011408_13670 [Dyella caseinilytica]|nr:hypothetical protein GCM10011408_13670 [Dyella caseinilytica]
MASRSAREWRVASVMGIFNVRRPGASQDLCLTVRKSPDPGLRRGDGMKCPAKPSRQAGFTHP